MWCEVNSHTGIPLKMALFHLHNFTPSYNFRCLSGNNEILLSNGNYQHFHGKCLISLWTFPQVILKMKCGNLQLYIVKFKRGLDGPNPINLLACRWIILVSSDYLISDRPLINLLVSTISLPDSIVNNMGRCLCPISFGNSMELLRNREN